MFAKSQRGGFVVLADGFTACSGISAFSVADPSLRKPQKAHKPFSLGKVRTCAFCSGILDRYWSSTIGIDGSALMRGGA